ncbi:hypothetical protein RIR_jg31532.t1 [Rhizophagus irregularis DAOM 181602=DAOM 197198]|nr:hypothetical protein RIR_jg31532.t1 [Rhizophagus irregularis DAOM 181602=DAOM 197198]
MIYIIIVLLERNTKQHLKKFVQYIKISCLESGKVRFKANRLRNFECLARIRLTSRFLLLIPSTPTSKSSSLSSFF